MNKVALSTRFDVLGEGEALENGGVEESQIRVPLNDVSNMQGKVRERSLRTRFSKAQKENVDFAEEREGNNRNERGVSGIRKEKSGDSKRRNINGQAANLMQCQNESGEQRDKNNE